MDQFYVMRDSSAHAGEGAGPEETQQEGMQPYFMTPDYTRPLEEAREEERELRRLQSMYPDDAKLLLPYIEEACDRMEYEGSLMFDEYPDRMTVYRIEDHIFEQVKDRFPEEEAREPEEVLSMQYRGPREENRGRSWARDLVRVLLLDEMHHRRRRHREIRRKNGRLSGGF